MHEILWFSIFIIIFHVLLFAFAYQCIPWHIPLIPFSNIINISLFVNNSNFTPVFFKQACFANPGADKKWAGSSSYILIHLFLKFSNTSASNNVSLWTYESWYSSYFFISNSLNTFLSMYIVFISNIFKI